MCDCKECEKFNNCVIGKKEKKYAFWVIILTAFISFLVVVAPVYVILFTCNKEDSLLAVTLIVCCTSLAIIAVICLTILLCKKMRKCQSKQMDSTKILLEAFNKAFK